MCFERCCAESDLASDGNRLPDLRPCKPGIASSLLELHYPQGLPRVRLSASTLGPSLYRHAARASRPIFRVLHRVQLGGAGGDDDHDHRASRFSNSSFLSPALHPSTDPLSSAALSRVRVEATIKSLEQADCRQARRQCTIKDLKILNS